MARPKDQKFTKAELWLRDRPLESKMELKFYLRHFLGVYLPEKPIEKDNSCPLDFVWDVYETALATDDDPDRIYSFLGMASRGSKKSLSAAVLEFLLLIHERRRSWFHMASIREQSYVTYEYFRRFVSTPIFEDVFPNDATMRETITAHGTKLKIGTGTMDSVNSSHCSLVRDEVDLMPARVFQEARGILSAEQGKRPICVDISSRKFAFGNIQTLIKRSSEDKSFPLKVHKWGVLEDTQACEPARYLQKDVTEIWVDDNDLIALSKEEFKQIKSPAERVKYQKMIGHAGCLKCGIFSFCQGRLTEQSKDNPYLQPIEVTKSHFKTDDPEFFKSQRLNKTPSSKGLVYPMWDEMTHVKTYAEMWEIFKGESHPDLIPDTNGERARNEIEMRELVNEFIKNGCEICVAIDFGFSVKAVCGLYVIDGSERVYFIDEIWAQGLSDAEFGGKVYQAFGWAPVSMCYPDPESPSGIKEVRKATGWAMSSNVDKRVRNGIGTVQRFLRTPGTRDTKLFIAPGCTVIREEIPVYRNKIDPRTDEPIDEVVKINDHSCFVAGTMVETDQGPIPIETLKIGDMVLTRQGYKPIIDWAMTDEAAEVWEWSFSNGSKTIATANHPIWVEGVGFIPLSGLTGTEILCSLEGWQKQKKSFLKGLSLAGSRNQFIADSGCIFYLLIKGVKQAYHRCIEKSGKIVMAKFLKAITFITKMEIPSIIPLKILNACQNQNIIRTTALNNGNEIKNFRLGILKRSGSWQENGTEQKVAKSGIQNKLKSVGKMLSQLSQNAFFVVAKQKTRVGAVKNVDIVQKNVNQSGEYKTKFINSKENAFYVEKNTLASSTAQAKHAVKVVVRLECGKLYGIKPVYNITVADAHEYFANGILVSNCDQLRYFLNTRFGQNQISLEMNNDSIGTPKLGQATTLTDDRTFTRAPTPQEYADKMGIANFTDNRKEAEALGLIPKDTNRPKDDEDPGAGFSFSF